MQEAFQNRERLYFLPVGGTAMATLAGLLAASGHAVSGVDSALYPPMSTLLDELAIPVRLGFDPAAVPRNIDRVIIGNAVGRDNPEVQEILRRGVPYLAQAEAVAHYLLAEGREAMVVAGTHGKTTTASLLAWIMETCGTDPTALVGGLLSWSRRSFRLGRGRWMIIEGDEYNTAFFDRGPKFLHYRPRIFLLGPVEYDHADIFPSEHAVLTAFRAGTAQVPRQGRIVVNGWSGRALAAVRDATAPTLVVGPDSAHDLSVRGIAGGPGGMSATLRWEGREHHLQLPLWGTHNVGNGAMALAAALASGVAMEPALQALSTFPGVRRRLEIVGQNRGITIVDDFAHHPTALAATVDASRHRWPGRRLVLAYEPRSLTAGRALFQEAYARALAGADVVLVAPVYHRERLGDDVLDRAALARDLERQGALVLLPDPGDDPAQMLTTALRDGDVVVVCSSGDFGGLPRRLLAALG
ncbi:MAG: UDP-N-acetylmuramate:L-alanyl-gamma-D-glutamyl-meso-diaminopimelate ligase [Acidobacteria bacterium]|nr:UDP-N-acetylmuramate:L-alanyl-gamma-D-glutamyl-meso-diaminopimelate ligase [Acidobacteriota bacterium]